MFGGTVAYGLAMARSDLLAGVVAIDAPPSRLADPESIAEAHAVRRAMKSAPPEDLVRMAHRRIGSSMRDQALARSLAAKASRSDRDVVADTMFTMLTTDRRGDVPRIKTPVLALLTTGNLPDDAAPVVEEMYRDQLASIAEHELVVVKASKHYVMFDAPDAFFPALDRFLAR